MAWRVDHLESCQRCAASHWLMGSAVLLQDLELFTAPSGWACLGDLKSLNVEGPDRGCGCGQEKMRWNSELDP